MLNMELAQVLLALGDPQAVAKSVKLAQSAGTLEEQIAYLLYLRQVKNGWTPQLRRDFFAWFNADHSNAKHPEELIRWFDEAGTRYNNGNEYNLYLTNIRNEALATLTDEEIQNPQIAAVLAAYQPTAVTSRRRIT